MTTIMKLLAIDTSTEACSAALAIGKEITERFVLAPRQHAELILPMVAELLAEAGLTVRQLDGLAFGCGPGAFTGLRIAAGVIQGLAFGADLPVVPVSSLAALAQDALDEFKETQVLAAIDARISEIYWGAYRLDDNGSMRPLQPEAVVTAAAAILPANGDWFGVGTGWAAFGQILLERLGERYRGSFPDRYPRARAIARIARDSFRQGLAVSATAALPVYLRDRVAEVQSA